MRSSPWIELVSLALLAIYSCPAAAKKEENSLTEEVDMCKGDPQTRKTCELCAATIGQGFSVETCCEDNDVMNQCQYNLRKKRDVISDGLLPSSDNEALYEALTNQRVGSSPFQDKRARYMLGKRTRNNFLGKRDGGGLEDALPLIEYLEQEGNAKRNRHFLGKKARPFIGKRSGPYEYLQDVEEDMGRYGYDNDVLLNGIDGDEDIARSFVDKRGPNRPFLGKRDDSDDIKRASRYMLGKREDDKRASRYMLGKREDDKRASRYMLGKREDDKRASRYMLGKRDKFGLVGVTDLVKRRRYMLGKRDDDDQELEKRRRYMLGKRDDDDGGFDKRRRYMLGKRDDDGEGFDKRRRYMLGKRDDDGEYLDKRRRYMLGKRSINSATTIQEDESQ